VCGGDQGWLNLDGTSTEVKAHRTSVSTWMGDRHGKPGTVNLGPFVGVDLHRLYSRYGADTRLA